MEFVGKSFSGVLKILAVLVGIVILGYLLIYAIPFLLIAVIAIYAFMKAKKHFKTKYATKNANVKNSKKEEANFKAYDNLDGEIIDVDYKDV